MSGLTNDLKRDLILSIGIHSGKRPLSPVEVGEGLAIAKKEGMKTKQIAELVQLEDSTMIGRFLSLLNLHPKVRHFVDWGQSSSTISFSAASVLSRLEYSEQEEVVSFVLKNSLTKTELIQIVQIKNRSDKDIKKCIEEVLRIRPRVIQKYLFIGSVFEKKIANFLENIKQKDRDELFGKMLNTKLLSDVNWNGRLGKRNFSLIGSKQLAEKLHELDPDFEEVINKWLSQYVQMK